MGRDRPVSTFYLRYRHACIFPNAGPQRQPYPQTMPSNVPSKMPSIELTVRSGDRLVTDLTGELTSFCTDLGDGLVNVFVPHATAGVALIETGSGSESDLAGAIDRLLPAQDIYRHRHGSTGHGRDHVLPAFIGPSISIPVLAGQPLLGTWQCLVLVDSNTDNPDRLVRLSFLAG
jgi:secondary thiamine-phosphate synthase enzyme